MTTTGSTYRVVARIGGQHVVVSDHATYDAALAAYAPLEAAHLRGRLYQLTPAPRSARTGWGWMADRLATRLATWPTDYLAVRSSDDPRWQGPTVQLVVADSAGSTDVRNPARRLGSRRGLVGHEGGWVTTSGGHLVVQGWHSWAQRHTAPTDLFYADRRWYAAAAPAAAR